MPLWRASLTLAPSTIRKRRERKMKCCSCEKEVDTKNNDVPPKWYGIHVGADLKKVVCDECIKTSDGMAKYEKRDW